MHSYAILVALLFVSFGFTSAFADESFVDPNPIPQDDFHKDETGYSRWDDLSLTTDFDGDTISNWDEIEAGTNPLDPDDP